MVEELATVHEGALRIRRFGESTTKRNPNTYTEESLVERREAVLASRKRSIRSRGVSSIIESYSRLQPRKFARGCASRCRAGASRASLVWLGAGDSNEAAPAAQPGLDEIVAKVLAKMNPDVMEAVTREILGPLVEAMIKNELQK